MDVRALASDMRTTSSFLLSPKKRTNDTEFACYVRNHTGSAIALQLALGRVEREPQMSDAAFAQLQDRVRAEVAAPIAEVDALIAGTGTDTGDATPSPPRAHADPASFDEAY